MLTESAHFGLPLFQAYPRLAEAVPWLPIGNWPTPVRSAPRFASASGLATLHVKREDLAHPQWGGNKVRGLEFILADVQRRGAHTIVTVGTAGSHHISRTACHARRFGIHTVGVVVPQPPALHVRDNLLCAMGAGATYVATGYAQLLPKAVLQLLKPVHWQNGRPPYYLAPGGTSPLACLGHVNAALELRQQIDAGELPAPDYMYAPLGSLGTAAGLAVGCALAGIRARLVGVVVAHRWYCTAGRWARLTRRIHRLMQRFDPSVPDMDIDKSALAVVSSALGPGYGRPSEAAARLQEKMRDAEGIELDGTYTAKTLVGALQFIDEHGLHAGKHLFWHTFQRMYPTGDSAQVVKLLPRRLQRWLADERLALADQTPPPGTR